MVPSDHTPPVLGELVSERGAAASDLAGDVARAVADPDRLARVRRTGLLDTPPHEAFDRLTRVAARVLRAPVAMVTLVDEGRDFVKSCVGLPEPLATAREIAMAPTFCQYAVATRAPLVVTDALLDPRVAAFPAVTALGARACVVVPLVLTDGHALGSFCVVDFVPRAWAADEVETLVDLAGSVLAEVELHAAVAELGANAEQLEEQALELELSNQQLQEQSAELEAQTEELQSTADELAGRAAAAERAAREADAARAQLHAAFAQAPAAVAVTTGPDHRFVLANARAEQVARRPLVGRAYREVFPEFEAQGFAALLDRVYATGEPFVATEQRVVFDRSADAPGSSDEEAEAEGWYNFVYQPLVDAAGRVTGIMQHAVDVSAEVRARDVLAERARERRMLIDAIPTLAWTARADGHIDWYNARWYEDTGTTPAEMEGWGWQSVHDPAELPRVLALWQASIATGAPFEMTFPLRAADGRFRAFLTRVTAARDADGQIVRWFGTNTDVEVERAARDAAEAAVARTERLQALTAALAAAETVDDVAAVVVAEAGAATGATTAALFTRAAGSDEAVTIRHSGLDAMVLARYGRFRITMPGPAAFCLRTGEPVFVEARGGPEGLLARFPEIPDIWERLGTHAVATLPLLVAGGVVGAMSFTFAAPRAFSPLDRAFFLAVGWQAGQALERARLLDAERSARQEAERLQHVAEAANAVKAQFLATMSHELRTPLNAIQGYVQLLDMGIHGPMLPEQRATLARVDRAQRHLLGLINDVLNYARLESGKVEYDIHAVRLTDVVSEVVPLVEPQFAARNLALDVRLPDDDSRAGAVVWADREKLAQVLLNLLSNAAKFTPAGGRVTVDLPERAEAERSPDVVRLRVVDTGPGVPADKLEAIFEPFVQLTAGFSRSQEGTGLGLAISRDLARGMGGDLRARSESSQGATFTVTLRRVITAEGEATDRRTIDERRAEERRSEEDRRVERDPAEGA